MFIDEVRIYVKAGDGGNGCLAFRREKYVPRGGPSGGDGGRGGDVYLVANAHQNTLLHLRFNPEHKAERGRHGEGSNRTGHEGHSVEVEVPVGTVVWDADRASVGFSFFITSFAVGVGGTGWLIQGEVFPTSVRGTAAAIAAAVDWLANYALIEAFPAWKNGIGLSWVMVCFAVLSVAAIGFVVRWLPETRRAARSRRWSRSSRGPRPRQNRPPPSARAERASAGYGWRASSTPRSRSAYRRCSHSSLRTVSRQSRTGKLRGGGQPGASTGSVPASSDSAVSPSMTWRTVAIRCCQPPRTTSRVGRASRSWA